MNIRTFVAKSRTFVAKSAIWFSENEGGGQRPFGTFPKIHQFWRRHPSLTPGVLVELHLQICTLFHGLPMNHSWTSIHDLPLYCCRQLVKWWRSRSPTRQGSFSTLWEVSTVSQGARLQYSVLLRKWCLHDRQGQHNMAIIKKTKMEKSAS